MRRPAPSGPATGAVVAAVVVVALLFLGAAAGVGWMLLGPKKPPADPAPGLATLPPPGTPGVPTSVPLEPTAPAGEMPEATPTPEEPSTVTVEELGVPTLPPAAAPRPTPTAGRTVAPPTAPPATPPPAPTPAAVADAGDVRTPAEAPSPASRLERVVPFRTKESVPVGIDDRFITIESVEVTAWPKPDEVRKAAGKPGETTKLTVKFTYTNRDDDDWKCIYRVQVLDDQGKELGSGVQERTLSGTEAGDTNRVSVEMRTVDFPKAAKLRVKILARPD